MLSFFIENKFIISMLKIILNEKSQERVDIFKSEKVKQNHFLKIINLGFDVTNGFKLYEGLLAVNFCLL